jgi:hypothetical protein
VTGQELEVTAALRAHSLLLEALLAYEIREAAHVAMVDPEQVARRLADKFSSAFRQADDALLGGAEPALSAADRTALATAVRSELDRVVNGTIARLAARQ